MMDKESGSEMDGSKGIGSVSLIISFKINIKIIQPIKSLKG